MQELLGASPAIEALRANIGRLMGRARGSSRLPPVLIQGETGTGKGLVAGVVHRTGPRADGPFVAVNCAAIPEGLLEAELFGFERGAFTDAKHAKPGLFQTAHRGVLFLDEVGLLPAALQAKLLNAIEEGSVRRLGSTRSERIDVWIISASNVDLRAAILERRFREDLYQRLAGLTLFMPPLRERGDDVIMLAEHYLARASADFSLPPRTLTTEVKAYLLGYRWPGNVRELANLMERAALLSDTAQVTAATLDLKEAPLTAPPVPPPGPGAGAASLDKAMRDHLQAVLEQTGGNITHTAAILGIARNTLRSRIRKLGIKGFGAVAPSTPRKGAPLAATGPATQPEVTLAPRAAVVRWERRHVTMLRVALAGTADESLFAGHLLSLAAEKALGCGGRIEALGQTRLDASFGVVPIENAARRAVSAALAFHKAVLEAARPGFAGTTLIHTEQTTVGQVGEALVIDEAHRAVLGGTLDRLARHASPGVVQVSGMTAPFLARHFELRGVEVSGAEAEPSFIVVRPDPSGLGAWRRLTRFVGRQTEMDVLQSRWELASRGRGQVVGLVGEPGVGKSRLLLEFTRTLDQVSELVLRMATSATEDPSRSRPAAALLGSLIAIEPGDGPNEIREKLAARLSALKLEPELLPPLAGLLDVEVVDDAWTQIDPQQRAQRMLDALRRLIVRESVDRPITIVLEDLHWIDADTQVALDHLIDVVPTAHILFLVAYRPEYRPGWSGKTFYTQLRLDSLPALAAGELLDDLLGVTPDIAPLKPQLLAWTEGNPFFLEEAVRTLVETGGLAGAPGAYRVTDSVVVRTLPATVEDTLAARIHRLPADVRLVLQCAATIGIEFAHAVLTSLVNLGEETLAESLRALENAEFVYPAASAPTPAHMFKHALTHLVTYRSVSPERQRILHAQVLRLLETLHSGQLEVQVEALAEHAFRAELWESAAKYLQAAGTRALARSPTRTAVDHLERAIVALDRVERRRDVLERAIDIRLDLRYALALLGQYERALPRLREAEALALELNDTPRQGRVVSFLANGLYLLGDHAGAITAARRATEIAQLLDDFPTRVTADIYAGRALHALGRYRESTELFRGVVDAFSGDRANEYAGLPVLPAAYTRSYLAMGLSELGDFAAALAAGHEAVAIADATGHPDTIQWASYAVGLTLLDRSDADGAIVLLERALSICRSAELPVYVPRAAAALGHASAMCGRDDGLALLEGAAVDSETPSQRNTQARTLARLAEVYLLAGRIPEGTDCAGRSLTLAEERGERGSEAHALRVLALAYEAQSRVDESRTAYERALALATEVGMQPLVALCHLGLGRLERVAHRRAVAATHLLAAHEAFERLEMARWDHATVAELALLG